MTKSTKQVAPSLALGAGLGVVIASIAGETGMWLALSIAISVVLGELMSKKDKGQLKTRS
jgi:predicted lysophospholipase L1 biosynthesis ABC-type transport system permease subunit